MKSLEEQATFNRSNSHPDVFERAIIGAIMQSPQAVKIAAQCDPEIFANPRNLFAYEQLREKALAQTPLGDQTAAVGIHQASGSFEHFPTLESVTDFLDECVDVSQPVASWPEYLKQAQLAFTRRKLLAAFDDATVSALSATNAENAAAEAIYKVIEAAGELRRSSVVRDESQISSVTERYLEQYTSGSNIIGRFPQEFLNVNGGVKRGQVMVLCAPTGTGKSWSLLDFCLYNALEHGMSSRIYTMEMDETDIIDRLLALQGVAELDDIIQQKVAPELIEKALQTLAELPISIVDKRISPGRIIGDLAAMAPEDRPDHVGVDHMDLFNWKEGNETNALKGALANFKDAAKVYGVFFTLVAQFRRSRNDEEDKSPHIGMLKGGSAIEQIADIIQFINKEFERTYAGDDEIIRMWLPKLRQGKSPPRQRVKFKNYRFR